MMKRLYVLSILCALFFGVSNAQVTVTNPANTTPGLAATYTDLASAITALNAQTAISGPVVITLAPGNPQTNPAGGYAITAILAGASSSNQVTIDGGNNTITAPTPAGTVGNLNDAIFKFVGSDFMTLQNFVMNENGANTATTAASNNMVEWGVALLYASTTNGAQNITIQNNTITLNRTYQNTFGIYSNSTHSLSAVTTSASATTAAGGNSGLKIYGNNISNVNNGVVIVGPTAAADFNTGIDVGGSGGAQANTITNYGTTGTFSTYANVSGTVNGVLVRNSTGYNVSFNTITSSVGGVTVGTLNGIQAPAFSVAPTITFTSNVNNNTISLKSGLATGAMNGISLAGTSASATSVINVNNNNFVDWGHTITASGTIIFINQLGTHLNSNINGNTFSALSVNTTGSVTFISQSYTAASTATKSVNNNLISTGFTKTGAGGTVTFAVDNGSTVAGAVSSYQNNSIINGTLTGTTSFIGISCTDGGTSPTKTILNNIINNWTTGASSLTAINVTYLSGVSSISNNSITNLNGQGAISGINIGSTANGATSVAIASNTINNLISTGTGGSVTGIACANSSTVININSNIINTLSTTAASVVNGISITGASTTNVFKNKIYDLAGSNASSTVNGIIISAGTTVGIYNNIIGDLRTPVANASIPLVGINISGGTTINVRFNTVRLDGTSSGALFGSAAIYASTTPTVDLRNNIFVNSTTPVGALGFASAHRRTGIVLTSFASTSNTNEYYAGTPGVNNLIFYDGTNSDQTIGAYKTRVSPREANSIAENPTFTSTTGSNALFLHMSTTVPTQIESGGAPISGIVDDFDGDTRNISSPDIGADEFSGVGVDMTPPVIAYTPLPFTCDGTINRVLTATITDASFVPTSGIGLPVLYWKINAGSWSAATASPQTQTTFNFSFGMGATLGDSVSYYIVAQDNAGTPNIGAAPSAGASGFSVNPPAVSTPPTNPSKYFIRANLSGTYTVGVGGNYTTLASAINAYNTLCLSGPVVFSLTDASYTTTSDTIKTNPFASAVNTLTIQPAIATTITGNSTAAALVLRGANFVTIDGSLSSTANTVCPLVSASRDLTYVNSNAGTSSAVIWLTHNGTDGSNNNVIKNCNIVGNSPTTTLLGVGSGGIIGSPATTANNNNNSYINNNFSKMTIGVYSGGISAALKNSGTIINQNQINTIAPNNVSRGGIAAFSENNINVKANKISEMVLTNTTDAFGITLGNLAILTSTTSGVECTNATITGNTIGSVRQTNTYSAMGIYLAPGATGTSLIANNMLSGVSANATSSDFTVGIFINPSDGSTTNVHYNTISLSGTQTGGSDKSFGIAVAGGTNPTVDIKNNIVTNTQNNGTGVNYAIGLGYTTFTNITSNNNDLFTTTGALFAIGGTVSISAPTNQVSLANWQTATTKDGSSKNVAPVFVSPTDLHLDTGNASNISNLNDMAAPVSTVIDFDCEARHATTPDIGSDEFAVITCTGTPNAGISTPSSYSKCEGTTQILTVTGLTTGFGISYQWKESATSGGPYTNVAGATAASYTTPVLAIGTKYYVLETTCSVSTLTNISNEITIAVNPKPSASISPNGTLTLCTPGTQEFTASTNATSPLYQWKLGATIITGETNATYNATAGGSYQVVVTQSTSGCKDSSAFVVLNAFGKPTGVTATASPTTMCAGETLNLTSTYNPSSIIGSGMNAYLPTRTTGTGYTSIIPATTVTTWRNGLSTDDNLSDNQPIGFSFTYNGVPYTTFRVSTNGFVTLDNVSTAIGSGSGAYGWSNNWTLSGSGLIIAPNWDDLQTANNSGTLADLNNSINYSTAGSVGSRILTVEWKNMQDFSSTSTASYNWQIKFYEGTNKIEFIYGTMTQSATTVSYSLGLSAATVSATPTAAELLSQTTVNTGTFGFSNQNILNPVPLSNTTIAFQQATPVYSWTGPNSFTSTLANPTIALATAAASGTYNLVISNSITGCSATAATSSVSVTGDMVKVSTNSGAESLRKAIECANMTDTIYFDPAVTMVNLTDTLLINKNLTLQGNGVATMLAFDLAAVNEGIIVPAANAVTFKNISIKNDNLQNAVPLLLNNGTTNIQGNVLFKGNGTVPEIKNVGNLNVEELPTPATMEVKSN